MPETSVNEFRKNIKKQVDSCVANHEVLKVKRRNGEDFVVISETDWKAIEETLYLNRIPGLVKSIHQSDQEPLQNGTRLEDLDWWPGM